VFPCCSLADGSPASSEPHIWSRLREALELWRLEAGGWRTRDGFPSRVERSCWVLVEDETENHWSDRFTDVPGGVRGLQMFQEG